MHENVRTRRGGPPRSPTLWHCVPAPVCAVRPEGPPAEVLYPQEPVPVSGVVCRHLVLLRVSDVCPHHAQHHLPGHAGKGPLGDKGLRDRCRGRAGGEGRVPGSCPRPILFPAPARYWAWCSEVRRGTEECPGPRPCCRAPTGLLRGIHIYK